MSYLLDNGADPNTRDEELGDPLQTAASIGNLDIMILLLNHKAVVNGHGGHFGNTLQAAAFCGHKQAVQLLIKHGANMQDQYDSQPTRYGNPLQAAVYGGYEEVIDVFHRAPVRMEFDVAHYHSPVRDASWILW